MECFGKLNKITFTITIRWLALVAYSEWFPTIFVVTSIKNRWALFWIEWMFCINWIMVGLLFPVTYRWLCGPFAIAIAFDTWINRRLTLTIAGTFADACTGFFFLFGGATRVLTIFGIALLFLAMALWWIGRAWSRASVTTTKASAIIRIIKWTSSY